MSYVFSTSKSLNFNGSADYDSAGTVSAASPSALLLIGDTVPGDTSSTATPTVGGAGVVSTIEATGDKDFHRVTFEVGKTYEIGTFSQVGGPSGVPLIDS